jgi:DNA polymerase (family 10)
LDKAAAHAIPDLITTADIRGVIHTHSTWSDGLFSIQQMAEACISRGYEYLVVSDHSVTSFYANGLDAQRIMKQHEEIDALNQKLSPFKIYKSIECDILGDGRLDYDDAILSSFDLVIVSVHQNLKMTEEKAMSRLLQAIANPHTRILGHPSGRLLLSRKAYPLDYPALIAACKQYDVVIEINANPRRLDIDWQWIQEAIHQGVMLSVNPDAHTIEGIDDIRYGVLSAQKGMLTADMNLSSLTREAFEQFLKRKQKM